MITITIGTTTGGHPLKGLAERESRFELHALETYGGFTKVRGEGGWKDALGALVLEPVLIYTFHGDSDTSGENWLARFAAIEFEQDCTALMNSEGEFLLIAQD